MIPDFTMVSLHAEPHEVVIPPNGERARWADQVMAETGRTPEELARDTPEQISIPILSTQADHSGQESTDTGFADAWPGVAPYLRGPYPTMYASQPWTVRQYAGYSTAEESNDFYRRNLACLLYTSPSPRD